MASPSKVNIENIERKMQGVSNTQDSIQSLSLWAIHHKSDAKQIVEVWHKVLRKAHTKQKVVLFNLCNDIVQNGKRKKATIYIDMFKEVLKEAIILVKDDSLAKNIGRILKIWKERHVFPRDFLAEIIELYESKENSTHNTPTPVANHSSSSTPVAATQQPPKEVARYPVNVDPQVIADFKPQTLIDKITNYKRFEAEVELKRKHLSNMKLDASSTEAIKQLKDKAHGNQFSKQFEESCSKLEDYVSSANKDIIDKGALIELLETSQLFYEEQYKEAKIVANAYKNFGTRINNLRKRLEDLVKSLPSPVPSPSRDAPSPGNTPPEDTIDNIESVDMDLDDEASTTFVSKSSIETSAVVIEDADESYDPGLDPYIPTQPQFSDSDTFTANPEALQNITAIMPSHHSAPLTNQGSTYIGQDPRKPNNEEIPVYNPPPKVSAIKVLSKQPSNEEGEGTPVKDEGSSTPVMDEKQDSPPPATTKHQNPIDFLTQILANTAKTSASGSNFLASLSLLTNTVKTQFQQKKEDTTTINTGSQPITSEQSVGSWAEWKAQNSQVPQPSAPIPPVIPPPVFPRMVQPPMSQPPVRHPQPLMVATQHPTSIAQSHVPASPPVLSTSPVTQQPPVQHPYAPVSAPYGPQVNTNPPRPPEPWRPPAVPPLQRPPFPSFVGQSPVRMEAGDHLSSPAWRQHPSNSQPPSSQPLETHSSWGDFHSSRQNSSLQSPPPQIVSPSVQPKGILRNRTSSLREVPLVENENMAINPEPPSEPPSPVDGRQKFVKQGSDSGGQVADDHKEFLEKLKRKTTGGPNFVSPPVIDEAQNNKQRMFATNRSRPNLTTITPVDFSDDHQMVDNHNKVNETENGIHGEHHNESLNAISNYTEEEEEYVQSEEAMEETVEEGYNETNDYEQPPEEVEHYEERTYPPHREFRHPFHHHPRPPPPHHEPFYHPRFPPPFEHPYRRDPRFPDFRDPYGGPMKRPYHDNYRPYRRPFHRY